MKVSNFIMVLNGRTKNKKIDQQELFNMIVDIIKPQSYLPYDQKIELAMNTIKETSGMLPVIPYRNRAFIINLINVYTVLEAKESDFDLLSQNMLLELILSTFEKEYKICSSIMAMCLESGVS